MLNHPLREDEVIRILEALHQSTHQGYVYRVKIITSDRQPTFEIKQASYKSDCAVFYGVVKLNEAGYAEQISGQIRSDLSRYFIFYTGVILLFFAAIVFGIGLFYAGFDAVKLLFIAFLSFIGVSALNLPRSEHKAFQLYLTTHLQGDFA